MCCAADNHNFMCHTNAKEFLDLNINYAVIDKIYQIFTKLPQIPHIHINCYFQVHLQLLRPNASSLSISRQGHVRNTL